MKRIIEIQTKDGEAPLVKECGRECDYLNAANHHCDLFDERLLRNYDMEHMRCVRCLESGSIAMSALLP